MPEVERVKAVFKEIPHIYDTMNTLMSLGMDVFWRLDLLSLIPPDGKILDVGTGTGKLESLSQFKLDFVGIDVTREMLSLNRNKGKLMIASATTIPIKEEKFDAVVSSFVLRNLPSTTDYFREGFRILRKGGVMANLDAFPEERKGISEFFSLYFYNLVPRLAKVFTSSSSYDYLISSVRNFKRPETIEDEMVEAGFREVGIRKFLSPSAAIVYGRK